MKRLYNEYGAAPHEGEVAYLSDLLDDIAQRIWDEFVLKGNCCPRDTESFCHAALSARFAENILRRARAMSRAQQANHLTEKDTTCPGSTQSTG